jgi:hypothetical protein
MCHSTCLYSVIWISTSKCTYIAPDLVQCWDVELRIAESKVAEMSKCQIGDNDKISNIKMPTQKMLSRQAVELRISISPKIVDIHNVEFHRPNNLSMVYMYCRHVKLSTVVKMSTLHRSTICRIFETPQYVCMKVENVKLGNVKVDEKRVGYLPCRADGRNEHDEDDDGHDHAGQPWRQ